MPSAHRRHQRAWPEDQELILTFRRALRSDTPIDLLGLVSSLLVVSQTQLAGADGEALPAGTLRGLVDSFIEIDLAETTAVLTVIQALTKDES